MTYIDIHEAKNKVRYYSIDSKGLDEPVECLAACRCNPKMTYYILRHALRLHNAGRNGTVHSDTARRQ